MDVSKFQIRPSWSAPISGIVAGATGVLALLFVATHVYLLTTAQPYWYLDLWPFPRRITSLFGVEEVAFRPIPITTVRHDAVLKFLGLLGALVAVPCAAASYVRRDTSLPAAIGATCVVGVLFWLLKLELYGV